MKRLLAWLIGARLVRPGRCECPPAIPRIFAWGCPMHWPDPMVHHPAPAQPPAPAPAAAVDEPMALPPADAAVPFWDRPDLQEFAATLTDLYDLPGDPR